MNLKALLLKYALAGLILLITLNVSAQKKERAPIDSLLRQLSRAKDDTNRVKLLDKLGSDYSTAAKSDSAVFCFQRALKLSEKLNWKNGAAGLYYDFGDHYNRQNDYTKAQNYYRKAVDLSFAAHNYQLAFKSARNFAGVMSRQNKTTEGNSYLDSIATQFKKTGRVREQIGMYIEIAGYDNMQSDLSAATDYFNKAMILAKPDPDKYLTNNNILNIAYFYINSYQTDKARAILLKAEAKYKKAGNLQDLADIYDAFAENDLNQHNYPAALADYRKGAQIAEKIKYDYVSAWSENGLGWAYYSMKKYDSAYVHTKRGFPYAKKDSELLIRLISNLGSIYREASVYIMKDGDLKPGQQYERSVELLAQSVNFGIKHGEGEFANINLEELSKTYQKMHRFADAFKTYTPL
jgi:tetratricopeptide (TPR) repeat protein